MVNGGTMGVHHSVIDCLIQRVQATGMINEPPRSDRPRKTTHREDRLIAQCARRNRFATSASIRDELNFWGHESVRGLLSDGSMSSACALDDP